METHTSPLMYFDTLLGLSALSAETHLSPLEKMRPAHEILDTELKTLLTNYIPQTIPGEMAKFWQCLLARFFNYSIFEGFLIPDCRYWLVLNPNRDGVMGRLCATVDVGALAGFLQMDLSEGASPDGEPLAAEWQWREEMMLKRSRDGYDDTYGLICIGKYVRFYRMTPDDEFNPILFGDEARQTLEIQKDGEFIVEFLEFVRADWSGVR